MPYFLFHIETEKGEAMDQEGSWFPDIWTAQQEASAAARELVADSLKSGFDRFLPKAIIITELSGKQVAILRFDDVLPRRPSHKSDRLSE
jgi:hypothetical protein